MRNLRACVRQDALCYLRMHSVAWICLGRFWIEFFFPLLCCHLFLHWLLRLMQGSSGEGASAVTLTLIE